MEWISVKDRLPEEKLLVPVRAVRNGSRQQVQEFVDSYGHDIHGLGRKFFGCECTHTVTHWQDAAVP